MVWFVEVTQLSFGDTSVLAVLGMNFYTIGISSYKYRLVLSQHDHVLDSKSTSFAIVDLTPLAGQAHHAQALVEHSEQRSPSSRSFKAIPCISSSSRSHNSRALPSPSFHHLALVLGRLQSTILILQVVAELELRLLSSGLVHSVVQLQILLIHHPQTISHPTLPI